MYKTIAQQGAEIPRPKLKAVEVSEGKLIFQTVKATPRVAKPAVEPENKPEAPIFEPLLALSDRKRARLALRAWKYDVLTRKRANMYEQFKQQLHDELDAREAEELHLKQIARCRKHEAMLAKVHA